MNWLLIAVLAVLVINSFIGMRVGLIKTVFSLFSMILALGFTIWLNPYVNDFLRSNDKLNHYINTRVEKMLPLVEEKANKNEQVSTIEGLHLPQSLKDSLLENNNAGVYKELAVKGFKGYLTNYLTGIVINALSFSVTFIVTMIVFWFISVALDIISKLPFLHQINKTAGLLAGLLQGLIIVWVFCIILTVFQSSQLGQKAMELIGKDEILSFIYNNNFLLQFITGATKMLL